MSRVSDAPLPSDDAYAELAAHDVECEMCAKPTCGRAGCSKAFRELREERE